MKPVLSLLLCLLLVLALCACGAAASEKPADMQSVLPGAASAAEETAEEPEETEAPVSDEELALEEKIRTVLKLKNRPVSELYDAIGEPDSEDSAPSCMGPGEDVNLYYDGFTVYTYREGESQIVVDAERSA